MIKNIVTDLSHYAGKYKGFVHSICNFNCNIPTDVPVVFHNGSNFDCHLIIKEEANEFEKELNCVGENSVKYKTFSIPITKEVKRIAKNTKGTMRTISYKLKFIDSLRFTAS